MNPDSPKTPQEEMEMRLLALLLGELPEEEAAAWRAAIATNPELAKLHERLKQTVNLVREASAIPAEPKSTQAAPLQLSEERREKLLAHFKTVKPKEFAREKRRLKFMPVELAAALAIIAVLTGILVTFLSTSKRESAGVSTFSSAGKARMAADSALERAKAAVLEQTLAVPDSDHVNTLGVSKNRAQILGQIVQPNSAPGISPAVPLPTATPRAQIVLPSSAGHDSAWGSVSSGIEIVDEGKKRSGSTPSNFAGDPEWVGLLERPEFPHSATNRFITRYAGIANPPPAESADQFRYHLDLNRDAFYSAKGSPVATPEAAPSQKTVTAEGEQRMGEAYVAGRAISSTTGLPVDNLSLDGATVNPTVTTTPEQAAFAKRYGLPGAIAASGGSGGGGVSGGGMVTTLHPAPSQIAPGYVVTGTAASPTPLLGDLPSAGKLFRTEQPSSETRGRGISLLGITTNYGQYDSYRLLSELQTDSGVASTNSLNLAFNNDLSRGKSGGDALTTFGANTFTGASTWSDDMHQKQGNVALAEDSEREVSRSKLQEALRNGAAIPEGGRITPEGKVHSVDVAGPASVPTDAVKEAVRRPSSSIILPSIAAEAAPSAVDEMRVKQAGEPNGTPSQDLGFLRNQGVGAAPEEVDRLRKKLNISDTDANGNSPTPQLEADVVRQLLGQLLSFETQLAKEETQLRELEKLGPTERGEGVMRGLSNRVSTARATVDSLKASLDKAHSTDIKNAEQGRPYYEAKRRLEELQRFQTLLSYKMASEKIDAALPKSMSVEIVDKAEPPSAPSQTLWERIGGKPNTKFQSASRIKVERDASDIAGLTKPNQAGNYDPYFIQTEFETIQSDVVLGKVAQQLNLNEAWAKKHGGEKLKTPEAVSLLKKQIELRPVPNTSLVEIRAKSDDPNEAAKIANAVAEVYHDYRLEKGRQLKRGGIDALKQQSDEQEKKVREAQKEVERLQKEIEVEPDVVVPRQSATNAPIPQPEVQTSDDPFSTFSLNVSDVSFKLAAASLEKGQMPDPASVRSEEFINAFDYRDPEPQAGAPIAFAWERARYPFAHNRDLLRFSLKTAAAGRQAGRPLNIVLLLDNSGSMERADRVQIIREALRVLATQLQPQDKLSVITFARTARLFADGVSGDKAGEVTEQVSGLTPQGGTNLEEAMNLAYQTALRHYLAGGINCVVLLTDGAANLGNVEPESLKQKVEAQRQRGIALDCFGIGWEGFNDDLLEVLSRNGDGRYGFINSPEEAATEFAGQLAGALKVAASDVKVQVEFNPRRVTAYRQIGYAKHQLTQEQFRDNTVDAAEIAAQEAGNALYTVEVNPAGEGPLGTVRVRYKIPGTADYREQAWDVPYTGNALPLEQSSPAMRLAASASAFSEWLAASPFAGEVTLDHVLGYLSGVPEIYGADPRPKKLEWMIRQAKSLEGK